MLVRLTISNFAIINHLEIDFQTGLNILSGETGAGKSIIINAVNLILGGRASNEIIRTGSDEAQTEALFSFPDHPSLKGVIEDMGFPFDGELLIKRLIARGGRNKVMINGSMATLQMLSRVGQMLLSISGQHEHQLLLRPENHLFLLDDFGLLTKKRLDLADSFYKFESLKEQCRKIEKKIMKGKEKKELNSFQLKEIAEAELVDGEDDLLEEEKNRLKHAEQLKELVRGAYRGLYEKEDSILSNLSVCMKDVDKGSDIDSRLLNIMKALESARAELEEAGLELRDLQSAIVDDPFRLEEVEERLQLIKKLKKKYGATIGDVIRYRENLSGEIENLDELGFELAGAQKDLENAGSELLKKAIDLSEKRKNSAKKFEKSVESELALLGMEGTRFQVRFGDRNIGKADDPVESIKVIKSDGIDDVEFMLSPNIGEDLKPLAGIASGGELSRIMLALKTILARKASVDTIIFDEVDAGIGGGIAEVVGEKLQFLSDYHQILCITHLPQIASKGEAHFHVKKRVMNGRTESSIVRLKADERVEEIARLLGGKVISEQAVAHAREMLG